MNTSPQQPKKTLEDAGPTRQQNIQINKQKNKANNNISDLLLLLTMEVTYIIISLISKQSCGINEISSIILQYCKEELASLFLISRFPKTG